MGNLARGEKGRREREGEGGQESEGRVGLSLRRGWSKRWLHARKCLWPKRRGQCLVRAATEWAASLVPVGSLGHVPL